MNYPTSGRELYQASRSDTFVDSPVSLSAMSHGMVKSPLALVFNIL